MLKHLLLVFIGFSGKKNYLRFCFHQKKYNPSSTIADVYKNKKSVVGEYGNWEVKLVMLLVRKRRTKNRNIFLVSLIMLS